MIIYTCKTCKNEFLPICAWFKHQDNYCTMYCWDISRERAALLQEHKDQFTLDDEQKKLLIQEASSNPSLNDRNSFYFELARLMRK